jgi:hypothetical protein
MKSLNEINWGWKKDKVDPRDFSAKKLVFAELPVPPVYFVNPNTPIYNQGSRPACVGYAAAGVKTDEEFIQHGREYTFNGSWLYDECKKIDGIPDQAGTYPRIALQILQRNGMRQMSIPCRKPQPDSDWKIKGYYRIEQGSSTDFIKQIIFQYGSIMINSYWYDSWINAKAVFPEPDNPGGGHSYRIGGWNDDAGGWVVVNSWGKILWGKAGISVMPYDMFLKYVLNDLEISPGVFRQSGDVWKLIDA